MEDWPKSNRISQSQLFPQSCFTQPISPWPVQADLREKLDLR